jgi:hypothetical protein
MTSAYNLLIMRDQVSHLRKTAGALRVVWPSGVKIERDYEGLVYILRAKQGSGVVIFTGKVLTEQLKFKLDNRCSNNQAEQLTIVKAL